MKYLVWSNEHGMWWRGDHSGYTAWIEEAGRYERDEAFQIVRNASVGGRIVTERADPVGGGVNRCLPEVMVQAPEEIPDLLQWAVAE